MGILKMDIFPSDEELKNEFNVDPIEFKKQVRALSRAAKKLSDMGFHVFGGNSSGRLVSDEKTNIIVAELDGDYEGGVGDDLVCFESND
jgi:hypothetical protein